MDKAQLTVTKILVCKLVSVVAMGMARALAGEGRGYNYSIVSADILPTNLFLLFPCRHLPSPPSATVPINTLDRLSTPVYSLTMGAWAIDFQKLSVVNSCGIYFFVTSVSKMLYKPSAPPSVFLTR